LDGVANPNTLPFRSFFQVRTSRLLDTRFPEMEKETNVMEFQLRSTREIRLLVYQKSLSLQMKFTFLDPQ